MSLLREHAGRYVCRAHNAEGTKQHSTNVVVLGKCETENKNSSRGLGLFKSEGAK